ncbi:YjgF-like protein [Xylaria sp. FL0043]|nr:YjgF-like protein [Xylaria sp. FL0043]
MHAVLPLVVGLLSWSVRGADAKLEPNYTPPAGVKIYNPGNFFNVTGPWSLMSQAGDTLYIAGMRGIYPSNSTLAPAGMPRVRQAFQNMVALATMVGADITSCSRVVVYVTDMYRYHPNKYPPRTIAEVDRLNEDDIVEVEGTFWVGGT